MKIIIYYTRFLSIRLFFLILALLLLFGSYFYTLPQISVGDYNLVNPFYSITENVPLWLYIVDFFIVVFSIAIMIIFLMIGFYNYNKGTNEINDNNYSGLFLSNLFSYLFSDEEYTEEEKKIKLRTVKKSLKNDHARKLFIHTLRRIHVQTTGLVREKTARLFKAIKYDYLITSNLHSPYLRHKLFALKIISDFQIEGYDKYILRLIKKRDKILRAQAIVALIRLNVHENLKFLNDLKINLTVWDMNMIIKTIQELKIKNIDYKALLKSDISEVSTLAIILVRLNQRIDFKSDVKRKIINSSDLVTEEAFFTLVSFAEEQEDFDFLLANFKMATDKAQLKIIQSLVLCPNKTVAVDFLNWVVENKPFTHKIEAIHLLLELDLNMVSSYKNSTDFSIRQSCLQVLDINI